jgi:hypothetical protein
VAALGHWDPDPRRPVLSPPRVRRRAGVRYVLAEIGLAAVLAIAALVLFAAALSIALLVAAAW